jgi:hypothetical protein
MARTELLGSQLHEKTRWQRVRWILALDDVAKLGRAATWAEWNKIWFRGEPYTRAAAKKALTRLCAELREFGVELSCSEGRFVDARGRALRALIDPWIECARRLDEEIDARRRRKNGAKLEEPEDDLGDDDDVGEYVVIDPAVIVSEYRIKCKQTREIGHLHRMGCARVLKILHAKGVVRERWEQRRVVERTRPEHLVEKALAVFDEGGGVREVARALGCSTRTAWKFLRRHDRHRDRGSGPHDLMCPAPD